VENKTISEWQAWNVAMSHLKWQSGFKMKCKTNQQRLVVGVYGFVVNHPIWGENLLCVLPTYAWKLEGKWPFASSGKPNHTPENDDNGLHRKKIKIKNKNYNHNNSMNNLYHPRIIRLCYWVRLAPFRARTSGHW
jgi:hypothetical protein